MTNAPIHLDVQTVARAALKAYKEGRLSAQGPTPACRYRDASGRPCAIGAAIPDDVAAEWDNVSDSEFMVGAPFALKRLQMKHDQWAQSVHDKLIGRDVCADREQAFVTLCRELAGVETAEQEASR